MIDVYFMLKEWGECVGGVSLREFHPTIKRNIWNTYKIFPISDNKVLFKRIEEEFYVIDGIYNHEIGLIKIQYINGEWININVRERK